MNPEVEFDWTRILKGQAEPQEGLPPRRSRPSREQPVGARAPVQPPRSGPGEQRPRDTTLVPPRDDIDDTATSAVLPAEPLTERPTSAQARLGSEGLLRLRARHAEILARISEKVEDPTRREELKLLAERLNPDAWVTDDEVDAGIEQYETVFASLRTVVGRKRRRGRKKGGDVTDESAAASEEGDDDSGEEPDSTQ